MRLAGDSGGRGEAGEQVARARLAALVTELRQERYRRGDVTQEVLAARLGVVPGSVVDWESGRDLPSAFHLVLWCRALGLRLVVTDSAGVRVRLEPGWRAPHGGSTKPYAQRELYRLAAALWAVRKARGLSQAQVAALSGVERRSVTRWESAQGNPRPLGLVRWAHALGCEIRLVAGPKPSATKR